MVFKKANPGCPCPDCDVASDDFSSGDALTVAWEGDTGSFTKSGGQVTTTTNDKVIANKTAAGTGVNHYAKADVQGSNAGDQAIVVVAYTDTSNYLYGRVNFGSFGSLSIWKNVGGTHTQISTSGTISISLSTFHTLEVCYQENGASSVLQATLTVSGTRYVERNTSVISATGEKAGVGSRNANGTVTIDNFDFDRLYSTSDTSCPMCNAEDCTNCDGGATPPEMQVEIFDLVNQSCGGDGCSDFEGTFVLTQDSGNACLWEYDCNNCGACGGLVDIDVDVQIVTSGSDYIVRGTLQITGSTQTNVTFENNVGTSKPDCDGLNNMRLDWVSNTGTGPNDHCNGDADSYMEVTALP